MNANSNLFSILPVPQDISSPVVDSGMPLESGTDDSSNVVELGKLFGSILQRQLGEKSSSTPPNAGTALADSGADSEEQPQISASEAIDITTVSAAGDRENSLTTATTAPELLTPPAPQSVIAAAVIPENQENSLTTATTAPELLTPQTPQSVIAAAVIPEKLEALPGMEALTADPLAALSLIDTEAFNNAAGKQAVVNPEVLANTPIPISPIANKESIPIENNKPDTHHLVNSHPLAGSLATLSDAVKQSTRQFLDVEKVSATESAHSQWSGKFIPPSGKNLPGNLPFITGTNDKPLESTALTDFVNKASFQSRQIIQASDSQSLLQTAQQPAQQQATLNELTSLALNPNHLNTIDKAGSLRIAGTTYLEGSAGFSIESPAGSADWNEQLGNKIRWMSRVNLSSAELKLHPAELGALEIKISMEDDQTKVSFLTNNSVTREIIEASLPRLRDLLANSGLQLEQSDVSENNFSENRANADESNTSESKNQELNAVKEDGSIRVRQRSLNQIDHYV